MRSRPELHTLAEESAQLPLMFRHYEGPGATTMEDHKRLNAQHMRIKTLMADGIWRTLNEIHEQTGDPESSISAQLRHMKKYGFGSHKVPKRKRGPGRGLWEYQLIINWDTEKELKPPAFGRELRDAARRDGVKGLHP